VRPVLLSLLPAANQVCENEATTEEQDCAVQKDLKTLLVVQMEARNGNVPGESEHGTGE
jgi:hypothetical protein